MNRIAVMLFLVLLIIASCGDKDDNQPEIDRNKILNYISEHNLDAVERPSGLFYVIENPGTGDYPSPTSVVTVRYTGYFIDGNVFDTNEGGVAMPFYLPEMIRGWQEGIPLFRRGGTGKLLIPSRLGYGTNSMYRYGIPDNSVLIFDIRLVDFY